VIRTPVKSSNLVSVGWHNNVLEIEFHNGAIYQYPEVPEWVYKELLASKSHGMYFRRKIEPYVKSLERIH